MKDDDDLDLLLGEIPHATSSLNLHHTLSNSHRLNNGYRHAPYFTEEINSHGLYSDENLKYKYACVSSPMSVSGFPLQFNDSSPRLVSGGVRSISDTESLSSPQYERPKSHLISGNSFLSDLMGANERNLVDDISLAMNFSKMNINGDLNGGNRFPNGSMRMKFEKYGASDHYWDDFSNHRGFNASDSRRAINFEGEFVPSMEEMLHEQRIANLMRSEERFSQYNIGNSAISPQFYRNDLLANENLSMGLYISDESSISRCPFFGEALSYPSRNVMNLMEANDSLISPNMDPFMSRYYEKDLGHYQRNNIVPLCEDSLIFQGENINYGMNRGNLGSRAQTKPQEKRSQLNGGLHVPAFQDNYRNNPKVHCSLSQAQGYMYQMAKDQNGCRFLQRMFEEGTSHNVQIILNEIIEHVVELMMNPFGNYMMQKLLEVCNEEQRMRILLKVTEKSGELVRISLNAHGTRVVQKLVELLETRQEIYLVISALEHDFLSLIKDLNGNHVVQKCLQCFTDEDSKFIYVAAAKYCVEIARHQHGCCVLQRCIGHSTGQHRENLVSEISANGILLAQDPFGNYVIQFILEQIPSAVPKLTSQFEGSYVQLSMQKFSSHVVEKCLMVCNYEIRSKIIRELLSATYFDQLLQDPHANYVIQTALRISEGPLHNSLVDAIECYKAISRNSPYSKRIFSNKLLKK